VSECVTENAAAVIEKVKPDAGVAKGFPDKVNFISL